MKDASARLSLGLSILALIVAASGIAYAAMISGDDIKNESVTGVDTRNGSLGKQELGFEALSKASLEADQKTNDEPKIVSSDAAGFTTILRIDVDTKVRTDMLALASVTVENLGSETSELAYRITLDGQVHHPHDFVSTVGPGSSEIDSFSLQCDLIPAGEHTLRLQVDPSAGVTFGTRTMNVVSMQDIH